MKVNELMIGDWVEFETKTSNFLYGKVEGIDKNYITIDTITAIEDVPIDKVGQIPVTPKILEKNFDKVGDYYSSHFMPFLIKEVLHECFAIYVTEEDMWKYNEITTFSSVHELQNILRVLGYSDLADNFKV